MQDWRRHLSIGTTVLSLLVALVSVTGAMLPTVIQALRSPDAEVRTTLARFEAITLESSKYRAADRDKDGREYSRHFDISYGATLDFAVSNKGKELGLLFPKRIDLFDSTNRVASGLGVGEYQLMPGSVEAIKVRYALSNTESPTFPPELITYSDSPVTFNTGQISGKAYFIVVSASGVRNEIEVDIPKVVVQIRTAK